MESSQGKSGQRPRGGNMYSYCVMEFFFFFFFFFFTQCQW